MLGVDLRAWCGGKQIRNTADELQDPANRQNLDIVLQATAYSSSDGISNVTSTTLMTLPRICDQYLKILILVENLLDATIISTLLPGTSLLGIILVIIA